MARIPYFDRAQADAEVEKLYQKLPDLNLFRMMGHSGRLMGQFVKFGNQLLIHSDLDPVLREIAIVRAGVLCRARYEVYQHEAICRQLGMSEDKIKAIHEGPYASAFNTLERQVMLFTDDVVHNVRASDATFQPVYEQLGPKHTQHLVFAIGFYMMVSRFLENFGVDIEDDRAAGLDLPGMAPRAGG